MAPQQRPRRPGVRRRAPGVVTNRTTATPQAPAVLGVTAKVITYTPAMSEAILRFKMPNRDLIQRKFEQFTRDMGSGAWHLNGEPVIFTGTEEQVMEALKHPEIDHPDIGCLDGQHRFWACVEANVPFTSVTVFGVHKDSMATIDTGAARQFSHLLKIKQKVNTSLVASACRWWWWYESREATGSLNAASGATHHELMEVLRMHPVVEEAASMVSSAKEARRLVQPGVLTWVLSAAMELDREKAVEFLRLLNGQWTQEDNFVPPHPIHTLYKRMQAEKLGNGSKLETMFVAAYVVKTWNAWVQGKPNRHLRWNTTGERPEGFPKIVGE